MKVEEIITKVIEHTRVEPLPLDKTCDKLMIGNLDAEVTKIVSTFMATVDVIKEAIAVGAQMIITHEPTWFTGADTTEWLNKDPVYLEKLKLIQENNIAIWRFHDHMHMCAEDGIYRGFDIEMGWKDYRDVVVEGDKMSHFGACYTLPSTTLRDLCKVFKEKLEMDVIQIVGNPDMYVKRVSVLVGGGSLGLGHEELPMVHMYEKNIDVVICGDITEWTLSAYVRDAAQLGMNKGMLVLGHERSEEAGMKHLGSWLEDVMPDVEIIFVDSKEPFKYL